MNQTRYPNRGNRKDNRKTYTIVGVIIGIALILVLLLGLLRGCEGRVQEDLDDAVNPGIVYDDEAVEGGWDAVDTEQIVENLNQKVDEGMINISMNTSPNFLNSRSAGNLMIVNEGINHYPQVVEIYRNDTDELIYRSGAIPVGSKIETAKLSAELAAGTYECTAMFYNVDPNTGNYLGCAGAIIHITIQE